MDSGSPEATETSQEKKPVNAKKLKHRAKRLQKRRALKVQKKLVAKVETPPNAAPTASIPVPAIAPAPKVVIQTYSSKDSSSRSYSDELSDYLAAWESRGEPGHQWKFSKVIQSWALDNCFQHEKIDTDLFKSLIPYIVTVQGIARDRLFAAANEIIDKCESGEELAHDDEDGDIAIMDDDDETTSRPKISKKMLKRARKVNSVLSS